MVEKDISSQQLISKGSPDKNKQDTRELEGRAAHLSSKDGGISG